MPIEKKNMLNQELILPLVQLSVAVVLGSITAYIAYTSNKTSEVTLKSIRTIEAATVYDIVVEQYVGVIKAIPTSRVWKAEDSENLERCKGDLSNIVMELSKYKDISLTGELLKEVEDKRNSGICGTLEVEKSSSATQQSEDINLKPFPGRVCLNDLCSRWIVP